MLSRPATIRFAMLAIALLGLASGCRTTDPSVQLLESELRYLEDKVYALQDVVHQKDSQIASVRRENETLRKQLGLPEGPHTTSTEPETLPTPFAGASRISSRPDTDSLTSPVIELGESSNLPELESVAPGPELLDGPLLQQFDPDAEVVVDRVVTQMQLNPKLTGGYNADDQPGDDGIMVVIEPQNEAGQYVDSPGPVSVVLLDPAYSGKEAFVGRWDFDTTDSAKYLKRTLLGKGVHLKLPWTEGKPEHESLQLHVRYSTEQGEVLQQKKDIQVDLRGKDSARWTPATVPLPAGRTASRPEASSDDAQDERPGLFKKPLWRPFR
ncbi:hypothetical protein [Bremerella sp. P1]|uniref:hypothetical protein n=1 Tax=Bremerella sp. P1 TaxID=3026424 RepID=UPI002367BD3C|nr:hypothetical protein [Bremerella sp. P1]WDI44560.1 hypothetical protein PSR63_11505 [Bremerella sp. P1]